mmetsp:Transcript_10478/g.14611  ORF Transcript_10478/g.14611 Transcript_10478/m.14611 type:complete len:95 (-) Transcript_10478:93-377(-)
MESLSMEGVVPAVDDDIEVTDKGTAAAALRVHERIKWCRGQPERRRPCRKELRRKSTFLLINLYLVIFVAEFLVPIGIILVIDMPSSPLCKSVG